MRRRHRAALGSRHLGPAQFGPGGGVPQGIAQIHPRGRETARQLGLGSDGRQLSVASGRSLDAIAADRDWVWHSNRGDNEKPPVQTIAVQDISGARKRRIPDKLQPQLATLAGQAPDGPEWLHEIKYDGYRLLARIEGGKVRLITRGGLDWTAKFRSLADQLGELPLDSALIDGELVHLEQEGTTSFSGLQDAISSGKTDTLNFFAFDLLYCDGWDLTGAALEDRKSALAKIISPNQQGMLRYSDHQIGSGPKFLTQACHFALEGIVSKRRTEPYRPGRSRSWLKSKCRNREEFVIVGYTDPEGSREGFGALLVGYYDAQGKLRYAGRVGTGFNTGQLIQLHRRLDSLARPEPTVALPKGVSRKGVHWIEPRLVAEVEFATWTADAILRQASFQGLREDKDARDVVYDPKTRTAVEPAAKSKSKKAPARSKQTVSNKAETDEPQRARDGSLLFEGVRLTHPDRILYPGTSLTKLDVARYYAAIENWVLPQLSGRLLTLVRSPAAGMKTFYQKHIGDEAPEAIKRFNIDGQEEPEIYPYIEDLPGLIGLVQMGVLEIHPWGSRVNKLEMPDRVTMDLDPDEGLPWQRVTEAAIDVRDALAGIGLKSFFTANMAKRARHGRIYIDYLRNGRGATAVGAYTPRARPGAPVSTPVSWEEVEQGVRPDEFTVETVPQRLTTLSADPWADIGKTRQTISAAVRRQVGI
ncbi:MAG: DNA ligase D [Alphaproteobacteria bacterium]|nr:MAG: DNA ligase D [Alphaproteobacteria bacterium]